MSRLIDADALIIDLMDAGLDQIQMGDYSEVIQVIERQPTVNPWHSVEEPTEEYGCYVVYRPYFPWTKAKYVWENGKNHWYSLNGEILCPTHWMSVEPPEEDKL